MEFRKPVKVASLSLGVLVLTAGGLTSAHADRRVDLQRAVYNDMNLIRQDGFILMNLNRERTVLRMSRNWRGVRATDAEIAQVRLNFQQDREQLRADRSALNAVGHYRLH